MALCHQRGIDNFHIVRLTLSVLLERIVYDQLDSIESINYLKYIGQAT